MTKRNKPIILVLISTYLPGERAGGPVRTTSNMVEWLGDDFDFRILTADRDVDDIAGYPGVIHQQWQRVGKANVRYLALGERSLWQLRNLLQAIPYDTLYINAVFATLSLKVLLLNRLRLLPHKPVIVAPRGQWRPEALGLKARKKCVFMKVAKLVGLYRNLAWHASNEDEKSDIEREVGAVHIHQIEAISNLPIRTDLAEESLIQREKNAGTAKIIFLSRIVNNKNLDYLLQQVMSVIGELQLDIYGSLEDPLYWEKCEALIKQLPENARVNYCGAVSFDQVLDVLSQYHLFVLPTLSENFGQAILEALIASCPVLISDRTPWKDLTTVGAGWVIPLEEPDAWRAAIQEMVNMDQSCFDAVAGKAHQYGNIYRTDSQPADELREFLAGWTLQQNYG